MLTSSSEALRPEQLAFGVHVLPRFLDHNSARQILSSAAKLEWVPSAAGVYENNQLVDTIELTDAGVLTCRNFNIEPWQSKFRFTSLRDLAMSLWSLPISKFSRIGMSRYPKGASIEEHQDTGPLNTQRLLTFVLYLNDDYEGGELVFPRLRVRYKPSGCDLVMFLSEYRHCVEPVQNGERYCMVWFGEGL